MDLLVAWLLYPAVLAVICLGLGLFVEFVGGHRLPGLLLLPVGLGAVVVISRLVTSEPSLAWVALPLIGGFTVAGFALGRKRARALRPSWLVGMAPIGVFAVFAAPVVLTGDPTFSGYLALPDTSHQLGLSEMLAENGTNFYALPDGSNQLSMLSYVTSAYPLGGQAAFGVTGTLGILDLAWLYQPFLAMSATMTALALAAMVAPVLRHRWQVAVVAFVAAQPSLVVGYALQGSIKEMTTLPLVVSAAALIADAAKAHAPARALTSLGVVAAAAFLTLGPASLPYLTLLALGFLVLWVPARWPQRTRGDLIWLGLSGCGLAGLALPSLRTLGTAIEVNTATLDSGGSETGGGGDIGNLAAPLKVYQALGPYLTGDFRYAPQSFELINSVFLVIAGLSTVAGLAWLVRRRHWTVLLLPVVTIVTSLVLLERGSPYADGKVLMLASPAVLCMGMLGAVVLWDGRFKLLAPVLSAVLGASVLWSSGLAYHDVSNTPYDRYEELLTINDEYAGEGPAIVAEHDEFAKYFLRDVSSYSQPEWPHDYREAPWDPNALIDPARRPVLKSPLDVSADLRLHYVQQAPLLVVRRSPYRSRPPSDFVLARRGRYYEVWRRTTRTRVIAHEPLGPFFLDPSARVTTETARRMGGVARRLGARLAYVPRRNLRLARPSLSAFSPGWSVFGGYPGSVVPSGPGRLETAMQIPETGTYRIWMAGSITRDVVLQLNGRTIGRMPRGLNNPGANSIVATVRLPRDIYRINVIQAGGNLEPGNGGFRSSLRHLGPIAFQPVTEVGDHVQTLSASSWRRLVGKRVDWIEVIGS